MILYVDRLRFAPARLTLLTEGETKVRTTTTTNDSYRPKETQASWTERGCETSNSISDIEM